SCRHSGGCTLSGPPLYPRGAGAAGTSRSGHHALPLALVAARESPGARPRAPTRGRRGGPPPAEFFPGAGPCTLAGRQLGAVGVQFCGVCLRASALVLPGAVAAAEARMGGYAGLWGRRLQLLIDTVARAGVVTGGGGRGDAFGAATRCRTRVVNEVTRRAGASSIPSGG